MTDIVEQAARVLFEHYSRSDGLDVTAQESAQALADAGLLRDPARTVPTREEIIDVLVMSPLADTAGTDLAPFNRAADAVRALMNGQPTVEEVKAQALEEAANSDDLAHWLADRRNGAAAAVVWLRERAQQHRGRK